MVAQATARFSVCDPQRQPARPHFAHGWKLCFIASPAAVMIEPRGGRRGRPNFDPQGNIYGTTDAGEYAGGSCSPSGCGVVYKLTNSDNSWTESVLYSFTGGSDGYAAFTGVILDTAGNLYGTTTFGGDRDALRTVAEPFSSYRSGSGWTKNLLHAFQENDGIWPQGALIFDASGNLYGTREARGQNGGGTAFMLSEGSWSFILLYSFKGADFGPLVTWRWTPPQLHGPLRRRLWFTVRFQAVAFRRRVALYRSPRLHLAMTGEIQLAALVRRQRARTIPRGLGGLMATASPGRSCHKAKRLEIRKA